MKPLTFVRVTMYLVLFGIGLILARAAGGWAEVSPLLTGLAIIHGYVLLAVIISVFFVSRDVRMTFGYTLGNFYFALAGLLGIITRFEGGFWDIFFVALWIGLLAWDSYILFDEYRTLTYRGVKRKDLILADTRPSSRGGSPEGGL